MRPWRVAPSWRPAGNSSYKALADLAAQLKHTVLMGHSQGGVEAAVLDASSVTGMLLVEPGS
jgi:pimeloyl-ACP methyl ester carboxylesterase